MDDHMSQPKIEETTIPNNDPNTKRPCSISTEKSKLNAHVHQIPTDLIMIPPSELADKPKRQTKRRKKLVAT